ncbi:hypothetical protein [Reyranella sp. CPCC 100927]|uniref:hypothetical protein n=1 Tax=Reyranella sp. CPCC 100927 TaxID=2599616 RepID=UPI0011B4DA0F|nr:hypothetical protein [Reyranella sp. CPCC 100927]TWS97833.1 hypothetical protein FQU96_36615 [Reyranella sp. CPCC 100927]
MEEDDAAREIAAQLVGTSLIRTQWRTHDWVFHFTPRVQLTVECPWRILCDGGVALGGGDHNQPFGLPEPVDGERDSHRLLSQETIETVSIRPGTADLAIGFSGGKTLEVLNMSSGYEGWKFGSQDLLVIALGGGKLAIFGEPPQA